MAGPFFRAVRELGNAYAPYAGHWDAAPQTAGDDMEGTTDTATPVSTAETTTTAAPAITETTSATTTSQRPTNVQELASWMEKAAATTTDPAATPETAATGQAAPIDPTSASANQGPIPLPVHKKAIENAREKGHAAATAEFQTQLSQVVGIPPAELSQLVEFSRTVHSDPQGHTFGMLKGLLADPTHGPAARSELARLFGGLRPSAPVAPPDFTPDVQITDESGRVVGTTFSAEKVKALLEHSVQERIAPLQQESEQRKQERDQQNATRRAEQQAAEELRQLNTVVDDKLAEINDHLGIDASMSRDEQKAIYDQVTKLMDADPALSATKAAARVARTLAESRVVGTFNKKAAGNTARAGQPATPTRPRNAQELASWMEANFR